MRFHALAYKPCTADSGKSQFGPFERISVIDHARHKTRPALHHAALPHQGAIEHALAVVRIGPFVENQNCAKVLQIDHAREECFRQKVVHRAPRGVAWMVRTKMPARLDGDAPSPMAMWISDWPAETASLLE